jgi:hypothetical protein
MTRSERLFGEIIFKCSKKKKLQWKPLNGITLGQRQIDSNNRLILIGGSASTYIGYDKVIWDLPSWINLMPLTD